MSAFGVEVPARRKISTTDLQHLEWARTSLKVEHARIAEVLGGGARSQVIGTAVARKADEPRSLLVIWFPTPPSGRTIGSLARSAG